VGGASLLLRRTTSVYLAGPAGAGKRAVASALGSSMGVPVHVVEAQVCLAIPPGPRRQECFATAFMQGMHKGPGVYSNHLLSVYGYSMALGLYDHAAEVEDLIRLHAARVVLLAAPPHALRKSEAGLGPEAHAAAQTYMVELARRLGYPVVEAGRRETVIRVLDALNRLF